MHFNHRSNCFDLIGQKRFVNLHMHPYLTLKKLTDLLFADHEMPDHLKEVMLGCKNISSGCSICLHKCIKFDGVVQGIPVTHIYCSTSEEQNGTRHGKRFDWVELNTPDEDDNTPVYPTTFGQVSAIVELKVRGQISGNYLLVTARASKIEKRGNQLMNPFVTLKYDSNAFNLDELDVINKPAYVIPASTLRSQAYETEEHLRRRMLFVAIPYAFFNRDDWEDLSRGLTWSETEVSQGERQRLIAYRCTGADRARAMLECVRYLEKLMPVPKKDSLAEYRERYSSGYNIESIMSSHRREENITDMPEDEEFNFQCDEGMDSGDVDLMTRFE
jgi:hypothetical protein